MNSIEPTFSILNQEKTSVYRGDGRVKILRKKNGFSLIEVLIAMFLLMVGFLGVISVMWSSARAGSFSRQMTTAANLNEDIMEQFTAMDYDDAQLNDTAGHFNDFASTNVSASGFTRQVLVQNDSPSAGNKTIKVKISWQEGSATKTRSFTMLKRRKY
jgi:type IV pilus assembly protein PilV